MTESFNAANPAAHAAAPWQGDAWTRAVLETAVDAIVVIDARGHILFVNPAVEALFGHKQDDLLGRNVNFLMGGRDAEKHDDYLGRYGQTGQRRIIGIGREVIGVHRNGHALPLHLSVSEAVIDGHRVYTGFLRDLREAKAIEAEKDRLLHELSYRNRQLACLYAVGSALAENTAIDAALASAVQQLEQALEVPGLARGRALLEGECVAGGEVSPSTWTIGAPIYVGPMERGRLEVHYASEPPDWTSAEFRQREAELVGLVARRIGESLERRNAEAQILQASKLASIGELAAGVSHEINNPINGIMNCADILLDSIPGDHPDYEFLKLIRSEADRVAVIVRNLLTFSRHDKNEHSLARLCDIVEATLSLTRKRVERSRIHLEVAVPESLPRLRCRSEQLQQVLMNLLINAVHALDQRFPGTAPEKRIRISARLAAHGDGDALELSVRDEGIGIAAEHIERLFDPFFTTKGRDQGTGLGLSVSRGIVQQHGGRLLVQSELGRGATFTAVFPLASGWRQTAEQE